MNSSRRVSLLLVPLCTAALLHAQTKPTSKPTAADLAEEVTGAPDTHQARLDILKADIEKARKELEQLKKINADGGMVSTVREKLSLRNHETRSFLPETKMTGTRRPVRTMGESELQGHAPNTLFTVNDQPVSQEEYRNVYNFLKTHGTEKDPDVFRRTAIEVLALRTACIAEDPKSASQNRRRLEHAKMQLVEERRPFEELARELSQCKETKDSGGRLGKVKTDRFDALLMSRVFNLEKGDVEILESTNGYHLVECLDSMPDARDIRHIYVPYGPKVAFVHKGIKSGMGDLAFRNSADINFAPGVPHQGVSKEKIKERNEKKAAQDKRARDRIRRNMREKREQKKKDAGNKD